jgi:hypothetical protein
VLEPLAEGEVAGHPTSFVNELKLSDFKLVLTRYSWLPVGKGIPFILDGIRIPTSREHGILQGGLLLPNEKKRNLNFLILYLRKVDFL